MSSMAKKKISNRTKGIICIIAAAFGFAGMTLCVRLAGDVPSLEKAFFRNFVALVIMSIMLVRKGISPVPRRKDVPDLFLRCLCGTIGLMCNFYAIDRMVITDSTMLNKLSPFFSILFSIFLLREKPDRIQIIGVCVALAGSALIIKPGFDNPEMIPAIAGLIGGAGAGSAYTFVRKLSFNGEISDRIIFWFSAFSCASCLPFMIGDFHPMELWQFGMLMLAGAFGCVGQFGITRAYMYAPAKEISVYDYTQVLFTALLGWIFLAQVPDHLSVLGYTCICGAGIAMFFHNKHADECVTEDVSR